LWQNALGAGRATRNGLFSRKNMSASWVNGHKRTFFCSLKTSAEKIWIELEVSRADPVANHAKFGSAHLISPFPRTDAFVSLMSRDIVAGRANLAAHAIFMLRKLGLRAFQMPLLPELGGAQIKRLNQAPRTQACLPSLGLERLIDLTRGVGNAGGVRIHYATNPLEVMLNLAQWNRDNEEPSNRAAWGTRRVRYFVCNVKTGLFAPSKFCAYTLMPEPGRSSFDRCSPVMEIPFYIQVDQNNSIFDGQKAWRNLVALGSSKHTLKDLPSPLRQQFEEWLRITQPAISTRPDSAEFLLAGG
jgi:hypothetical protein